MHRARVQLHRLGHTHGEPEREHAGETAGDPIATHSSNIRWGDSYGRSVGAALTIAPSAATSSLRGLHVVAKESLDARQGKVERQLQLGCGHLSKLLWAKALSRYKLVETSV